MAKIAPLGKHSGPTTAGTPPGIPVITGTVDGGNGSSVVVSITGTDTIRLFYRVLHTATWIIGLTRIASGDIIQTGLSSGVVYEFYCVADDGSLQSGPSNIVTQRVSGTDTTDTALGASPAFILSEYIITELLSMTNPDDGGLWPLYTAHMPDGNNVESNCGALYGTSGILDGRLMTGLVIEKPGIQLRIRSKTYEVGFAKAEAVALSLDGVNNDIVVVDSITYQIQNISKSTPVVPLGLEKGTKRRFLFTINFLMTLKKVA